MFKSKKLISLFMSMIFIFMFSYTVSAKSIVVKKGDTLWDISQTYGVSVNYLVTANNISNPNLIYPNQILIIPYSNGYSNADYYIVKPDDNLWRISQLFGVSTHALVTANNISNPDFIYPGQTLIIPYSTVPMCPSYYVVKKGNTLWGISIAYGVSVNSIVNANHISNPNLIYPGQNLIIPCNTTPSYTTYYVVKKNDNLWNIARKYGVSVNSIVNANNISNPDLIYPGQRLIIPCG